MTIKKTFNTNAELDFPTVLPSLDLDFANSKTLDPRITFTRASGGSYLDAKGILKYAGINEARFDHDPETGESLGLLMEESRTNLLPRSQNFMNWTVQNLDPTNPSQVTIKESNEKSPDGITNFFSATYGPNNSDVRMSFVGGFGRTYTASCFYKKPNEPNAASQVYFQIHILGTSATSVVGVAYDFNTNRLIPQGANVPGSVGFQRYPNGVVRVWLTITDSGTGNVVYFLNVRGNPPSLNNRSILTWGAQIEEGRFPTSYIPTTISSTRTRASDSAFISDNKFSEWFNQKEGSIFAAHKALPLLSNRGINSNSVIYNISNTNNDLGILYNTRSNLTNIFRFNIDNNKPIILFIENENTNKKSIFSYYGEAEKYQPYIDGNKITVLDYSQTSSYEPTNYKLLQFAPSFIDKFNGHLERFTYYPKYLPDSQAQLLTL
jgi:hypothetical protein